MPGKKTIAGISVSALAAMGIVVGTEGDVLIPAHLELKVPVEQVLADRVYEKFEYDENGDPIPSSRKEIAVYVYKGGVAQKLPNEIARTPNTYTQKIDDDSFVQTSTLGQKFIRDADTGEWHDVQYATTTPEVFTLKRSVTMYETNRAWAQDTGFANPSTTGETNNDWSNPTNAYASDNNDASSGAVCSSFQDYGDFGLSVPAGATVDGIEIRIEASDFTGNGSVEVEVSNDNGTSYSTTNNSTATLTGTDATYNVGGSSTLWGLSWTVTDTDNDNFRVRVEAIGGDCYADIDHLQSKIYYTAAPAEPATTPFSKLEGDVQLEGDVTISPE